YHNWPMANDRMAAALRAKGYDYRYVVAENAAHVDGNVIAQTLPGALEWLWRDDGKGLSRGEGGSRTHIEF
ncbi:MAG: hypothetical protein EOO77_14760, partial [Oxalobacteraceae bacterium]